MTRKLMPVFLFLIIFHLSAQTQVRRILDVTAADFTPHSPVVNSETDAVVLLDSGATTLDATLEDGFFIRYYNFRRVLIFKKSSISDLSKITLSYSAKMNGKKLSGIHVFTYNLENGKVVKTALPTEDFYWEETKNDLKTVKFTFKGVLEGSIVEFDYTERAATRELQDWYFQGDYPKIKSVYTVTLPDLFNFSILFQNKKYLTNTTRETATKTVYSSMFEYLNTTINTVSWTFENVPAMREEPFTSTVLNYLACVRFQMSASPHSPGVTLKLARTWQEVCNQIMYSSSFGVPTGDPGSFIKKQAKIFAEGKTSDLEKAQAIYAGLRDHFRVEGRGIFLSSDQSLEKIYKNGMANVGEINSILIAMLRTQHIEADPVILATKDKGLTNQTYPLLDHFNYLICRIVISGQVYYLDASDPFMGFGKIPLECYNGHARVVTANNFPIFLGPDSIKESNVRMVEIWNDKNSKWLNLNCAAHPGYYESAHLRAELKSKSLESILNSTTQTTPFKKSLDSFSVVNLKNLDESLVLNYSMTLDPGTETHLYFNPFLNYGLSENPFKSNFRNYPVEMPYVSDNIYQLTMEIPTGYTIEEMPKSETIHLKDSGGEYDFKIETMGNKISVKSKISLNRAIFDPEDYDNLRDFYTSILRKQNEMIVFKKL